MQLLLGRSGSGSLGRVAGANHGEARRPSESAYVVVITTFDPGICEPRASFVQSYPWVGTQRNSGELTYQT